MQQVLLSETSLQRINHIYDNENLTFGKLKEIFRAAANGELVGTEKTDGANIMISFSVRDGRARAVRNKTQVKNGGVSAAELAAQFSDNKNPKLKDIFKNALNSFEKIIHTLDYEKQVELFGENNNIYYNCEILDVDLDRVISYDTRSLIVHRHNHVEYDRQKNQIVNSNLDKKAEELGNVIKSAQERVSGEEYSVQMNAVRKLKALSDKKPLNAALSRINSVLSSVNHLINNDSLKLNDNSTIFDFILARVYILINSILEQGKQTIGSVDPYAKMNIAKRILGVKGLEINDITKKLTPEQKKFITENILNSDSIKEIYKTALNPIELIVSDFATEMLKGLESAFILDNSKEILRIKKQVSDAISSLKNSGDQDAMLVLKQQLKKLKSADNVTSAAEGFVFDYDGKTYKFTGNFAPINQIMNFFKKHGDSSVLEEGRTKDIADLILIPGAFKPPHAGHIDMIKRYSKLGKKVVVFMSPLPRMLPTGLPVTFSKSKDLFDKYLDAAGLADKVSVLQSPMNSPITSVMDFINNKENNPEYLGKETKIIIGCSDKNDDAVKHNFDFSKLNKNNLDIKILPIKAYKSLNSSDMRQSISDLNFNSIKKFLPDDLGRKKKQIAEELFSMFKSDKITESLFYDTIEETIRKKGDKYCLLSSKTKKNLGCYKSRKGAEKREKQVNYFKHIKKKKKIKEFTGVAAVQGAAGPLIDKEEE